MPVGNRMGPMGKGPMTGRGMGWCGGKNAQGNTNQDGPGFGMGRCRGQVGGRRHRHRCHGTGTVQRVDRKRAGFGHQA